MDYAVYAFVDCVERDCGAGEWPEFGGVAALDAEEGGVQCVCDVDDVVEVRVGFGVTG